MFCHSFYNKAYADENRTHNSGALLSVGSREAERQMESDVFTSTQEEDHRARVEEAITRMLVCALKTAEDPHGTRAWLNPTEVGPPGFHHGSGYSVKNQPWRDLFSNLCNHSKRLLFFLRLRNHPMKSIVAT